METTKCNWCLSDIPIAAKKCKYCQEYTDPARTDFDNNLKKKLIDVQITTLKAQDTVLSLQKINAEWQNLINPSIIKTNDNTRTTNRTLKIVFILTFIVSAGTLIITYKEFTNDATNSKLLQSIQYKDTLIQQLQKENQLLRDKSYH